MIFSHKMQQIAFQMGFTLSDFALTLEQERRKVLMFQRELPLCLEIVTRGTTRPDSINSPCLLLGFSDFSFGFFQPLIVAGITCRRLRRRIVYRSVRSRLPVTWVRFLRSLFRLIDMGFLILNNNNNNYNDNNNCPVKLKRRTLTTLIEIIWICVRRIGSDLPSFGRILLPWIR